MARLESWLSQNLGFLKPRFKIADSIRATVAVLREEEVATTKAVNHRLRHEIRELQAIIDELKRQRQPVPIPDILSSAKETVLKATLDDVRRKLAASDSVGTQLKNRLDLLQGMARQALELLYRLGSDPGPKFHALLADILRTASIGTVNPPDGYVATPFPPQPDVHLDSSNRDAMTFDDGMPVLKPTMKPTRERHG